MFWHNFSIYLLELLIWVAELGLANVGVSYIFLGKIHAGAVVVFTV